MVLTLIVNANASATVNDSTDARVGASLRFYFANRPRKPACAFRVTIFLEDVVAVKIVHTKLPQNPSDVVLGTLGVHSPLSRRST